MHQLTLIGGTVESRIEFGALGASQEKRDERDLLAVCAHELRNPLASLQCNLEVLRGRIASPALEAELECMEWQTRKLARIVEDLLEMSRASRGVLAIERERVDMVLIVERAIASTRHLVQERGHRLTLLRPESAVYVHGDAVRLEQVLVNLLVNACNYTDPGGRIDISVETGAAAVEVRVRDSGIGMSTEVLARAFELFARAGNGERRAGGLGIGLALVKELVELHGGTVRAASEGAGRGSEFAVRLPLAVRDAAGTVPSCEASAVPAQAASETPRKRVLVVDDSKDVADALAALIAHLGHAVRIACDGPTALLVEQEWRPDVVFLDIALPCMDGYAVARALRSARARPPLLVALTGYAEHGVAVRAREVGIARYLVKPPRLSALQAVLGEHEHELAGAAGASTAAAT